MRGFQIILKTNLSYQTLDDEHKLMNAFLSQDSSLYFSLPLTDWMVVKDLRRHTHCPSF
jgi:hypothetical protein